MLLYAEQLEHLVPEKTKEGAWRLPDASKVAVVEQALPFSPYVMKRSGTLMRKAMIEDYMELTNASNLHTNLYAIDDSERTYGEEASDQRVIKFTNGEAAYAVYKNSKGKVEVRLYVDDENLQTESISDFTSIGKKVPDKAIERFLQRGQKLKQFDDYNQAYEYVFQNWSERSQQIRKGISPLGEWEKFKALDKTFRRNVAKFFINVAQLNWVKAAVTALTVAVLFAIPAARGMKLITILGGTALQTMRDVLIEEGVLAIWDKLTGQKNSNPDFPSVRKFIAEKYMAPDTGRFIRSSKYKNSWTPPLDPKYAQHLRIVPSKEARMNHRNSEFTGYEKVSFSNHWLATAQNKLSGGVIAPFNAHMFSAKMPNGLIGVFHANPESDINTSYMAYRPDLVIGDQFVIPPEALRQLSKGVVKVKHVLGDDKPKVEPIDYMTFTSEVSAMVKKKHLNPADFEQILQHVHCLFNEAMGVEDEISSLANEFSEQHPELCTPRGIFEYPPLTGHHLMPEEPRIHAS